ncbi:hypothetical protein IDG52_00785 [Pelagibacterales bacterium SAG-MED23]|nr:hypothetical protein [Pelagibacterales bacterium SAG-MED23]
MNLKISIVCPLHNKKLSTNEIKNLTITSKTNPKINKYFVLPNNYKFKKHLKLKLPKFNQKFINKKHFQSIKNYNNLMLSTKIYKMFSKYDYMIINQSDAVIIKDLSPIENIIEKYDYIGAPWRNPFYLNYFELKNIKIIKHFFNLFKIHPLFVGNGGLSIRKIKNFSKLFSELKLNLDKNIPEDIVISYLGQKGKLLIPKMNIAKKIFSETILDKNLKVYGYHALEYWSQQTQNKIYKKFSNI